MLALRLRNSVGLAAAAGNGNGFPAPQCLHKLGRFRGNQKESRGVDGDVESAPHQQLDRKNATSCRFLKPLLIKCKSRRPVYHFPRWDAFRIPHLAAASVSGAARRASSTLCRSVWRNEGERRETDDKARIYAKKDERLNCRNRER
jgi:hypothetical protein